MGNPKPHVHTQSSPPQQKISLLSIPVQTARKLVQYPLEILFTLVLAYISHQMYTHSSLGEIMSSLDTLQLYIAGLPTFDQIIVNLPSLDTLQRLINDHLALQNLEDSLSSFASLLTFTHETASTGYMAMTEQVLKAGLNLCIYIWFAIAVLVFYSEFVNHFIADVLYTPVKNVVVEVDAIIREESPITEIVEAVVAEDGLRKSKRLSAKASRAEVDVKTAKSSKSQRVKSKSSLAV